MVGTDDKDSVQIDDDGNRIKVKADLRDGKTVIEDSFRKSQVNRIRVLVFCRMYEGRLSYLGP